MGIGPDHGNPGQWLVLTSVPTKEVLERMATTPAAIGVVCNDDVEDDADDSPTSVAPVAAAPVAKAGATVTPAAVATSCGGFFCAEKKERTEGANFVGGGWKDATCLSQEWRDDAWLGSPTSDSANPGLPQESSRHRTPSAVTMKLAVATVEVWVLVGHFSASSVSTMNSPPSSTGGHSGFALFRTSAVRFKSLSVGTATSMVLK